MQDQITQLNDRIAVLEGLFKGKVSFEEEIRDKVFFDIDNKTTTTFSATDSHGDTITIPKLPDTYVRIYFRGKVYNVPVYKIT